MSVPKVCVVGCGHWGKNLVRNFAALDALALVCDLGEQGRQKAAELVPDVPVTGDLDAVFGSDVDGVVFATPAETHAKLARVALESGKDVFVEKPLALDQKEAADLVALAQERGRMLMVGHVLEYHPAIRRIVSMVHEGDLGKLQYVYSNRLNLGKIRTEENILWSFAPHDVAIILRMVGSAPLQVTSVGANYITANVADATVSTMLFDNGVRAHVFVSWLNPFKEQRLVVTGSKAMVTYDDVTKELVLHDKRVELGDAGPVAVKGEGTLLEFDDDEPLRLECEAFLESIRTRSPALTDGVSGLHTLRVLQAAQRSLMTGGEPVSLHRLD
ncbi:MAG: Gfo/Idh/MocA family oxidoreductase [Planctomycetes bacterium]|nr:Gfo/Idh/MocA family oxidoreductase [Planctomycetota bacterium]